MSLVNRLPFVYNSFIMNNTNYLTIATYMFVMFVAGIGFSRYFFPSSVAVTEPAFVLQKSSDYIFINPLFEQTESAPLLTREVVELKEGVESIASRAIADGDIDYASVYYRDLNNGPWFSTGDENSFRPASLFKVPVMMAFFKKAESDPGILDARVTYQKVINNSVQHNVDSSTTTIELGKTYTVLELIENMIIYSDNSAAYLLLEQIDNEIVKQVFDDLAVPSQKDGLDIEGFGPRTYASYLRILYNSTYLKKEYSEQALEILSRSKFNHGMRAVLAPGIKASIKYGVAVESTGKKQFHECGIIYWQDNRPHVLCIMTFGDSYDEMAKFVQNVTWLVQSTLLD
jgi:beta-lactamase class A